MVLLATSWFNLVRSVSLTWIGAKWAGKIQLSFTNGFILCPDFSKLKKTLTRFFYNLSIDKEHTGLYPPCELPYTACPSKKCTGILRVIFTCLRSLYRFSAIVGSRSYLPDAVPEHAAVTNDGPVPTSAANDRKSSGKKKTGSSEEINRQVRKVFANLDKVTFRNFRPNKFRLL